MDININNSKMNVNISNTKKDISIETNKIDTQIENSSLNISTKPEKLDVNLGVPKIVTHEKNHANLDNLDFENSGHTGFQKAGDYVLKGEMPEKFLIKEYATYDDLPKPIIFYSYSTSFDYQWGPPEDYYNYVNGEWITDVEGVHLSIENPQYLYTPEDLANVTCKITSELPTDLYPDMTEDSFSLNMGYSEISPSYISVNYYPVLTTSYGDYEHNPWILGLNLSFDIILPPKPNSEVAEDVIYKVLDTNKCYILDTETYEWIEFDDNVLNLIPVMNFIDNTKQDKLVVGQNIATINNQNLLNGGNLDLVTPSNLSSYLLKTYVRNSRSTASNGYTYDVRYINNMVKTARTTSSYNTYDCTYINGLIKTSKQSSDNYTYSCNYINNNFLTLETLPRWDGGNQ